MSGITLKTLEKKYTPDTILYCECCDSEYSANPADYFWMDPKTSFTCEECEVELSLVRKQYSYSPV